ncbi:GNAT family N-acetyltransferase [bacterium]|nr:GNAT family N-acetyltransferase [bacterium]
MNAKYKILQVTNLTESMMMDCYYIAARSRPSNADDIYYTLQNNVNNRGHIMFVAMGQDHTVHGFISGHLVPKHVGVTETEIDWVFVNSQCQRHGIGGALMRAYMEYCSDHGATQAVVKPARTIQAKQFYTKHGFIPRSVISMVRNLARGR